MMKLSRALGPCIFAVIVFVSSFLIFTIEPMQAKRLLPFLGGIPTVWTGCLLFYQTVLLLGYLYAYAVSRLSFKTQYAVHSGILVLSLFGFLWPFPIDAFLNEDLLKSHPNLWLTSVLTTSIGYKFFILASTSSLMQNWFSRTKLSEAFNTYFLYAASNLGSLIGILLYPLWIEPLFKMQTQIWLWSVIYVFLVFVIMGLGLKLRYLLFLSGKADLVYWTEYKDIKMNLKIEDWKKMFLGLSSNSVIYWILYAFVPSSLMIGVTSFISTDIASFPFLWSAPLFIYTLSFVIVFSYWSPKIDKYITYLLPLILLILVFWSSASKWNVISMHLIFLFFACLACHGRLVLLKPKVNFLTYFYFYIALGGVLGGFFNVIIAPYVFQQILEYIFCLILTLLICVPIRLENRFCFKYFFERGSYFVSLGIMALAIINVWNGNEWFQLNFLKKAKAEKVLHQERSFFGVLKVVKKYDYIHTLKNGTIVHGEQRVDSKKQRLVPLSYYHPEGPLGDVFNYVQKNVPNANIAAVGLGVGTIAAYGTALNSISFYELNPYVVDVAKNSNWFSYMQDCEARGCRLKTIIGDGRIELNKVNETYDLVILDAFSSDSIPTHLLTVEAMNLYLSKLKPSGVIAIHITNRYINLEPVIGRLAEVLNLEARIRKDVRTNSRERRNSVWILLGTQVDHLFGVENSNGWLPLKTKAQTQIWTDDFVDVMSALKFKAH